MNRRRRGKESEKGGFRSGLYFALPLFVALTGQGMMLAFVDRPDYGLAWQFGFVLLFMTWGVMLDAMFRQSDRFRHWQTLLFLFNMALVILSAMTWIPFNFVHTRSTVKAAEWYMVISGGYLFLSAGVQSAWVIGGAVIAHLRGQQAVVDHVEYIDEDE